MLALSTELLLIEKCKIAVWMEQLNDAIKVQSKFKFEFIKYPPPVSTIIQIHKNFMETGSVNDKPKGFSAPDNDANGDAELGLDSRNSDDYDVNLQPVSKDVSLIEKWRNRPKIKIRQKRLNQLPAENVSITHGGSNEEEIKECMIEISLNEEENKVFIKEENNFTCLHCGHSSIDRQSHFNHLKVHSSSDFFHCPSCDFTCNSTSLLRSHRVTCLPRSSESQRYESPTTLCDEGYVNSTEPSHMVYKKDSQLTCNLCNIKFESIIIFEKHLRAHHKQSDSDLSSVNYFSIGSTNMLGGGTLDVKSDLVLKSSEDYKTASVLELQNFQITQTKSKIFSCDQCDFTTKKKVYLKNHKTIHSDDTEMKHECNLCGQKFRSKRTLSYHTDNSHIDKEFLECPFCDFRQKNKMLLQIHMRRHTGEKPYKCSKPHCDFKARISQELRRHLEKEHPPTPFQKVANIHLQVL